MPPFSFLHSYETTGRYYDGLERAGLVRPFTGIRLVNTMWGDDTHRFNHTSRAAIERLGAHYDGTLRAQMRMPDGHLRDTRVYSILDSEWPIVRTHLDFTLARGARP